MCFMYINARALQSVHGATRKTLLKIKGFSEVKVEKIKDAIQKCQVIDMDFISGSTAFSFYGIRFIS